MRERHNARRDRGSRRRTRRRARARDRYGTMVDADDFRLIFDLFAPWMQQQRYDYVNEQRKDKGCDQ
jgi:hypothetical protein